MSVKKAANPDEISFKQLTPPMIMESVLRVTVGVVNAAFLSNISRSAVSAVNVSTQYINMCQIIATAIATGTIVCLNQAVGMKNQKNINKYAAVAFFSNVVMGLLFGILFFFFSRPMLSIMTFETEELRNMAVNYMRVVGTSMVFQAAQIVTSNINRSIGYTKAPLFTNLFINGVNILGCYLVVNGHIFTSWHPMIGVAVSNVISQICGLIIAFTILSRSYVKISIKNIIPFPWKDFKLALSIGIPAGMNNMAYSASQLVTSSIISQTSQLMFDAKNYISSVVGYVALVGMAFAQSATILIGYRMGKGDFDGARAIFRKVFKISAVSNAFFSLVLIFGYKWIFNALYGGSAGFEEILPIAGVIMELLKNLLNIVFNGTTTAYVGEFANFVTGCAFILPAAFIYKYNKTIKGAIAGMTIGAISLAAVGGILNYFSLVPAFSSLYGMPIEAIVGMATKINPLITNLKTMIVFAVAPFNLLKGVVCSVISLILYKRISKILHI